jgi:hypothetical protein
MKFGSKGKPGLGAAASARRTQNQYDARTMSGTTKKAFAMLLADDSCDPPNGSTLRSELRPDKRQSVTSSCLATVKTRMVD